MSLCDSRSPLFAEHCVRPLGHPLDGRRGERHSSEWYKLPGGGGHRSTWLEGAKEDG